MMNYILSRASGTDRSHSQGTKPGPVLRHLAPAGIPCRQAGSCEGSLGHQETFPAGTFARVCARETTSVSHRWGESGGTQLLCSVPAPVATGKGQQAEQE